MECRCQGLRAGVAAGFSEEESLEVEVVDPVEPEAWVTLIITTV